MAVTRTHVGFLFFDDFNRADGAPGANWSVQNGTVAIVSNRLRASTAIARARSVAESDRDEIVMQCTAFINSGAAGGYIVRHQSSGNGYYIQFNSGNTVTIFRYTAPSTFAGIAGPIGTFTYSSGTGFLFKFWSKDSFQRAYLGATPITLSGTDANFNANDGTAGILLNNTGNVEMDNYSTYESNNVVCTGLPSGHKIRVDGKTATESSGTATLDITHTVCPVATIEILDGSNNVIDSLSPTGGGAPDGVWGGDTYAFEAAQPPDPPDILQPTEGQSVDRTLSVQIEDTSATGEGDPPTEYKVEHQVDGGGWTTLRDWAEELTFDVYFGDQPESDNHQLRAYARQSGTDESDAGAERTFTVDHPPIKPTTPTIEWQASGPAGSFTFVVSEFASPVSGALPADVFVDIAEEDDPTFAAPLHEYQEEDRRVNMVRDIGLAANTTYLARARWSDELGNVSNNSPTIKFMTVPAYTTAQMGSGEIGWSGGLVVGGIAIRDYSGAGRHGRHTSTTGILGSSYLNQAPAFWGCRFPLGLIDSQFGTDVLGGFQWAEGGQGFTWSTTQGQPDALSMTRHDGQAAYPDFGFLIFVMLFELPPVVPGNPEVLLVLSEGRDSGSPLNTLNGQWFLRVRVTGQVELITQAVTPDINPPILTGITLVPFVPTVIRLSHKYTTEGGTRSILKANGTTFYNSTKIQNNGAFDMGHLRVGAFASANLSTLRNINGVVSQTALWWNESDLDFTLAADAPKVESVGTSPAAILAALPGLELYWQHDELGPPEQPVASVVIP